MIQIRSLMLLLLIVPTVAFNQTNSPLPKEIIIPAKPEAIHLVASHTAIIVVDMQNDFGSKNGMFDKAGIDISVIQKVIPPIKNVLAAGRKAGFKIIYLKMGFQPDLSDLGSAESVNRVRHLMIGVGNPVVAPDGSNSRILIRDTWNTEIVPELKPEAEDIIVYKNRFSGFYQTELDAILKKMGITQLVFVGCTTSVCVESTMRDAMFLDYSCLLLEDCAAEVVGNNSKPSSHDATVFMMQSRFGWVSNSTELIKNITRSR